MVLGFGSGDESLERGGLLDGSGDDLLSFLFTSALS